MAKLTHVIFKMAGPNEYKRIVCRTLKLFSSHSRIPHLRQHLNKATLTSNVAVGVIQLVIWRFCRQLEMQNFLQIGNFHLGKCSKRATESEVEKYDFDRKFLIVSYFAILFLK